MAQNSTLTAAESLGQPAANPPTPLCPKREIASHVELLLAEIGLHRNVETGEYEWVEPSRSTARALCEAMDFYWPSVAGELRALQFARSAAEPEEDSTTPGGIPVRLNAIRDLTYDLAPLCPFRKSGISRSYRFWRWDDDCHSWACEKCGPEKADRLLRGLERILMAGNTNEVYLARAGYRPGLLDMMKKRNRKTQASYFWYRDVTDMVTFVSTKPLPAVNSTKEPRVWDRISTESVLTHLREALWVPGHSDHGLGGDWAGALDASDREIGGGSFDTRGLTDHQMMRALAIFKEEAKKDFGVDVDLGYIPQQHRPALDDLMKDIIMQVRDGSGDS